MPNRSRKPIVILIIVCAIVLGWSAWKPHTYQEWLFEVFTGVIGVGVLAIIYPRFRFSNLAYTLVGIHFAILAAGGKYTYALNPWFEWLKETFNLSRNHFDRVGHFAQGFVPAILFREVLMRTSPLKKGKWLYALPIFFALAISAFWELIEWWMVVIFYPNQGAEWLGMQGDMWDAQEDMVMALLGATIAVLLLSKLHNRSMRKAGLLPD